jgi:hypothetical protein
MNRSELDQLIIEQAALNAVSATKRKYPPETKLLLDMARAGTCGQPAESRKRYAPLAQETADFTPDRAASTPLADLAYVLREASDDRESHELCARGVGATWRAAAPFRQARSGDPFDVLLPHLTDIEALIALDRARQLPELPPTGLLKREAEINAVLSIDYPVWAATQPYSKSLASALLSTANAKVQQLHEIWESDASKGVDNWIRTSEPLIRNAQLWVDKHELSYSAALYEAINRLVDDNTGFEVTAERCADSRDIDVCSANLCREARNVARVVSRALAYVSAFNGLVQHIELAEKSIQQMVNFAQKANSPDIIQKLRTRYATDVVRVRMGRALFPDFYSDEEPWTPPPFPA